MSKFAKPSTVDRLSDLPDDILFHILTFLPTKFAFATSVLSKRRTSIYQSLNIINFDDEFVENHNEFLHFRHCVDEVVLSPKVQHQPIKTFRLTCRRGYSYTLFIHGDHCIFNTWVEAAKRRCVEDFHLTINYSILTPNIFTFQTLVVLKLERVRVASDRFCVDLP